MGETQKRTPMTQNDVRRRVVNWMRSVMVARDWSAEEWARRAETSPTNITRLLASPKGASLPTTETLGKLAVVAGSQPAFIAYDAGPIGFWTVAVLTRKQAMQVISVGAGMQKELLRGMAEQGETVRVAYDPSDRAFAVRVELMSTDARGIFAGDLVVLEPFERASTKGPTLVAAVYADHIGVWLYEPPFLVPQSTDQGLRPVAIAAARILGRCVHLTRSLQ